MTALLRMTGAVAALGAALVTIAVGAAPSALAAVPWLAVPLVATGVGQSVVAVLALRARAMPTIVILGPLTLPTVAWVAALALLPAAAALLPLGAMLGESALALGAAVMLGRARDHGEEPRALPALLSLAAAATVVAAVATAALADTEAGRYAVPHGEHGGHGGHGAVQQVDENDAPVLDELMLEHHDHH